MRLQGGHTLRLQAGITREDFIAIYTVYHKPLCKFAIKFVRELDIAEDIVQEVFISIWEKSDTFCSKSKTQMESYLFTAVKNRCINYFRQSTNRKNHNNRIHQEVLNSTTDNSEYYTATELSEQISEVIKQLPEQSRNIFHLSRYEGLKNKQIANQLNLTEKSIEYHITKTLRMLKEKLANYITIIYVLIHIFINK